MYLLLFCFFVFDVHELSYFIYNFSSIFRYAMIPKSLLFMLILAHVSQVVLSQARPPSNVPRLRGLRPPNPAVQSGFFGGLGSLLMDNDQLQESKYGPDTT